MARRWLVLGILVTALVAAISASAFAFVTAPKAIGGVAASGTVAPYSLSFALGHPASPQPADPLLPTTDLMVADRDNASVDGVLEPMAAHHGADCGPFPATHQITQADDVNQAIYVCHDHIMTAINAPESQSIAQIMPNALVDFSGGATETITMPISTLRTSGRDWLEFWITPFSQQLAAPQTPATGDEFAGPPQNAIDIQMGSFATKTTINVFVCRNFDCNRVSGNQLLNFEDALAKHGLKTDASRRDTYQIDLSAGHVKFSFPQYSETLFDSDIPGGLPFTQGVFQLIHRSYNPGRDDFCGTPDPAPKTCVADSWHIGGISFSRALPYTLLKADKRIISAHADSAVFPHAAPANSYLRFLGEGKSLQVSFDGGASWMNAQRAPEGPGEAQREGYQTYLTPIPQGVTQVRVRGGDWYAGRWEARNPIIVSANGSASPGSNPPATPTSVSGSQPIHNAPCTVTINGVAQSGTCDGTFTPAK